MSSFSSLWPAGSATGSVGQEQQQMATSQGSSTGRPDSFSHQPSTNLEVLSMVPPLSTQDSTFMQDFTALDQNPVPDTFGREDAGQQLGFLHPSSSGAHHPSSRSEFPNTFQLDPNYSTSHPISQPASHQHYQHQHHQQQQQHFQHAFSSQHHPSQQPQLQQSQHNSQITNEFQQLHPSSSSPSLHAAHQHQLQQHSESTGSQTDLSSQLSFSTAPSGTFGVGVPAGLFGSQYPGLLYGATDVGSQSTLADTSFDSHMFNSQEQSFSSFTSNTSQSVPGSQESRLGGVGSNSSLKDDFADSSSIFRGHEHLGSIGEGTVRRRSSAGPGGNASVAGLTDLTYGVKSEDAAALINVDTPPQQSSFDTTVAAETYEQTETQTTPQSHGVQGGLQQDGALKMDDGSPSRQNSTPNSVLGSNQQAMEMGPPSSFSGGLGSGEELGAEFTNSGTSSHFLSPPGFAQQPQQAQLRHPLPNDWHGQGWIAPTAIMNFEPTPVVSGSFMQPPSGSPANNMQQQRGSGLSSDGSSRFSYEPSTLLGVDKRGRSSTFSVPPELHVPPPGDATRPRSSTSSAGSYANSFTPPAPHSSGMSRQNSSASLAVFQPLEQLHISGGRPGTGGSTQGSVSSQNSGQFNFQRPGSGGFPSVPSFGATHGSMTPHGGLSHYGAVTTQPSLQGRFQRTELGGALPGQADTSMSPSSWQANANRLGVVNPATSAGMTGTGRKNKLRRAPSNLTLDSGYSSALSANSFSPSSFGLPSANPSEASPQFEQFSSMPSSATSSNALTAGSAQDYSQHYPVLPLGSHFSSQTFASSDHTVAPINFINVGGGGMTDATQLGLGGPGAGTSLTSKTAGSGYQTPTIMEEDESRMMQSVLSMDPMMPMPAQLFQSSSAVSSAGLTPLMPSSGWGHGAMQDSMAPLEAWSAAQQQHMHQQQHGTATHAYDSMFPSETGLGAPSAAEPSQSAMPPRRTIQVPQRSGPSVIVRYGGLTQRRRGDSNDDDLGRSEEDEGQFDLQPSTLQHAAPITMSSKFGPCGIPPQLSTSYSTWTNYKAYIRDQVCQYLATPSRLGLGERTLTIMTPKVGPKSYVGEKRYLCPLPIVLLSGNSWWTADPAKLLTTGNGEGDIDVDPTIESAASRSRRRRPMSVLAPPTVSIQLLSETNSSQGGIQWASSDGRLINESEGLKNKIPIAGRGMARQLYISDASDDKRKPVYATVSVSMPGPEKPIELGTFQSGPIKVISKAFRKRQGVRNADQSITHGSTVTLFFRTRSHTTPGFLCVSGPPTWIRGSDGQPFLKPTISNPSAPAADNNATFVVKTASWDSFVIYAVDPTVTVDEVGSQPPLNPRFPPPPASARPLRVDGESAIPILYNQPIVLQCMNTGVASPVMTIRAVEKSTALGGLPLSSPGSHLGFVPEATGEPVSHNHRISLEILDENGRNAVQPMVEGDPKSTPGRSGQFLACLEQSVGVRMCGPRKWLPVQSSTEALPTGVSITDADQPRSAAPMPGPGGSASQAAFIAAVAAAQTRHSLAQSRMGYRLPSGTSFSGASGSGGATATVPAMAGPLAYSVMAANERPSSADSGADGGKVRRPRRVSSSNVVPKDRAATSGRGRRRGQSLSTVGLGLHDAADPHMRTSASSTNLRGAAANGDGNIAVSAGCRWSIDIAESDVWSIMGTEQSHHTFYIPPAIQNGYMPPAVDLGPELSHLVRTPTPLRKLGPLPVLTSWAFSTTAHLGADFEPARETVELHGENLSKDYFVFFGDFESEVIDATSWRLICTPPPMWDDHGVPRQSLPITLVRDDGIIIPTTVSLTLKPQLRIELDGQTGVGVGSGSAYSSTMPAAPSNQTGGQTSRNRSSSSVSGDPMMDA
ncbi:unnamed protein product [Tilletia controversa]|nr:unnamed protein product [Tilletia controversa]